MIEHIVRVNWKAYLFALLGFLGGVMSNSLGEQYGVYVGLSIFLLSWWCVITALVIANRRA